MRGGIQQQLPLRKQLRRRCVSMVDAMLCEHLIRVEQLGSSCIADLHGDQPLCSVLGGLCWGEAAVSGLKVVPALFVA